MLRTICPERTLWEAILPEQCLGLPAGLAEVDRLLDDTAWLESDDPWRFRYLAHEESVVWGLTERIVAGLAPKLREALAAGQTGDPPAGPE